MVFSQPLFPEPLSQRVANYKINVELDADDHTLNAESVVEWINTSKDTVSEAYFHLYMNAFKNSETTFMQKQNYNGNKESDFGWIDIKSIRRKNGSELTLKTEFISPDDGNVNDQTVMRVPLEISVLPGDTAVFEFAFKVVLPPIIARSGYSKDYFFVGQWFPKLGVYQHDKTGSTGKWVCNQYHATSEFFADFGTYDVQITTPSNYYTGATGVLAHRQTNPDSTITFKYKAEDVIDFAWTASPRFVLLEDQWKHIKIKLLIQPEHQEQAERHFSAAKKTFEYLENKLGKYPYSVLTIIDPPVSGNASGGMEYPTLITAGTIAKLPKGIHSVEDVVVHELGHQYFMAMIASNEADEPWLDEGINTYFNVKIMNQIFGESSSSFDFLGMKMSALDMHHDTYCAMENPEIQPISLSAKNYSIGNYFNLVYSKATCVLFTLEGIVGELVMDEIMKTYFERFKFRHPKTQDFISVVNEIVKKHHDNKFGQNMNWFFEQIVFGTETVDYYVKQVSNIRKTRFGMFDKQGAKSLEEAKSAFYVSTVKLGKHGRLTIPVTVEIVFADGSKKTKTWDGKTQQKVFSFKGTKKIVRVQIDPEKNNRLDLNSQNNSYYHEVTKAPFYKLSLISLFFIMNLMIIFTALL